MCKKIKHASTWGAAQHILRIKSLQQKRNNSMGIYWCSECCAYHVTNKVKNCLFKTI